MPKNKNLICPWWLGYLLISPLRRLWDNPKKILSPYIREGMTILEIGPGMGFVSIPVAKMTGDSGKLICVDVQERMLSSLRKRAIKTAVSEIIETRLCSKDSLQIDDLTTKIDFVLAFAVIHEVPDKKHLFSEIVSSMKHNSKILISDPKSHETKEGFNETLSIAQSAGLEITDYPEIKRNYSVLLNKK